MNQEIIDKINKECPCDQGIFIEPYCIPTRIKEPVVYSRYELGGIAGRDWDTAWSDEDDDEYTYQYTEAPPKDHMKVLDLLIESVAPNITYVQYCKIRELIHSNTDTDEDYYGNNTDYYVEYIILSEIEKLLNEFNEFKDINYDRNN